MADDDVPLLALAKKPSLSKVNDDTPLSSLAAASKQTPQRKSVGGAARPPKPAASPKPAGTPTKPAGTPTKPAGTPTKPAGSPGAKPAGAPGSGAPKAKAKAGMKRRVASSDSYSSYSYSSSSDSEDGGKDGGKDKKKRAAPKRSGSNVSAKKKAAPKKKKSTEEGLGDDSGGAVKKRDRSKKEEVVAELLCRWWMSDEYQKNDWPPQDEAFYTEEMKKRNLRKVTIEEWEWVPDEEDGKKKVYELSQFRGVYRNSAGELIDLRPKDTCPCFSNFMKKDMATLCKMLISAYESQAKDLANSRYLKEAAKTGDAIKVALAKARKMYHEASQMK